MNPNQILISVIDGFGMKPQEVVSLLESVKAEYYIRMTAAPKPAPVFPFGVPNTSVPTTNQPNQPKKVEKKKKEKKKYTISEERRAQLREWANRMREEKLAKKGNKEKKPIIIPSKAETNLKDWADTLVMQNKMKQRLYQGLIKLHNRGLFLEDTEQQVFLEIENLGMDSWREFLKLRFEYFSK